MMRNLVLLMTLTLITVFNSNSQDFNIQLKIAGIEYDTVLIGFIPADSQQDEIEDIAIISNGTLNYKFDLKGFYEGIIIPYKLIHKFESGDKFPLQPSRIHFYINNGEIITIDATANLKDKTITYTTTGNELSKQRSLADNYFRNSGIYKDRIEIDYRFYRKKYNEWTNEENAKYWKRRNQFDSIYSLKREQFVLNNLDSEYSPRLILEINDKINATTLYDQLTPRAKKSYYGQVLGGIINGWAISTTGVLFPDFSAKTLSGNDFRLQDYKGKYLLLDFWGSWCSPCIAEIPNLKQLQIDYKDKLVIIGLVCNDKREKINKIIEKYQVNWVQLFDDENSFPTKYGVKDYPTKILINEKGFVIKTFNGTSQKMFSELREIMK